MQTFLRLVYPKAEQSGWRLYCYLYVAAILLPPPPPPPPPPPCSIKALHNPLSHPLLESVCPPWPLPVRCHSHSHRPALHLAHIATTATPLPLGPPLDPDSFRLQPWQLSLQPSAEVERFRCL